MILASSSLNAILTRKEHIGSRQTATQKADAALVTLEDSPLSTVYQRTARLASSSEEKTVPTSSFTIAVTRDVKFHGSDPCCPSLDGAATLSEFETRVPAVDDSGVCYRNRVRVANDDILMP